MKQNKVLNVGGFGSSFVNYKNSLIKNFKLWILKNGLGVLQNGLEIENNDIKGYYYSINTVYKCKEYLHSYFNKMFGKIWTDKKRSSAWNWSHHPKYLECISNIEARMINGYDQWYISWKFQYPELYQWMISLNNHQKSIVLAYFFVINVCA